MLSIVEIRTIKISVSENIGGSKSVNFGPGAEMLMNPNKQKSASPKSDININDLNNLDNLNLDDVAPKKKRPSFTDIGSNLFGSSEPKKDIDGLKPINISTPSIELKTPLNMATEPQKKETSDGFKTFNEIPVNPTLVPDVPKMTPEELLREK